MSPARRLEILATVAHKNRLPKQTTVTEVRQLGPLLRPLGWPRWQLTPAGWRAIEMAGAMALARNGTDAA